MSENNDLLVQLQQLLSHKKSKAYYATKLGISEQEIEELLQEIRRKDEVVQETEQSSKRVNVDKGTIESSVEVTYEPKNDIELAKLHKIDLTKYKISTYWSKLKTNGKFTSSVLASLIKPADYTPEDFAKFLSNWKPNKELGRVINLNTDIFNEKEY